MKYIIINSIIIDKSRNTITVDDSQYTLEPQEAALIYFLIENRNRVCNYSSIIGHLYNGVGSSETIRNLISKLRNKANGTLKEFILTRKGIGYEFVISESDISEIEDSFSYPPEEFSVEHLIIDNDYYVMQNEIIFVKHFTSRVMQEGKNSIHFRVAWFPDESITIMPLSSNIRSIDKISLPDTNSNYNIVFHNNLEKNKVIEYCIKVVCSNNNNHFQNFFSTQVIVPIESLNIHLHIDEKLNVKEYFTQMLSDSLHNKLTELPVSHEYCCPSHWYINHPRLHFEYKIFW